MIAGRAGPGRKKFLRAGPEISARLTPLVDIWVLWINLSSTTCMIIIKLLVIIEFSFVDFDLISIAFYTRNKQSIYTRKSKSPGAVPLLPPPPLFKPSHHRLIQAITTIYHN